MELCILWSAYADIGIIRYVCVDFGFNLYGNGIQTYQQSRVLPGMAIHCMVNIRVLPEWSNLLLKLNFQDFSLGIAHI